MTFALTMPLAAMPILNAREEAVAFWLIPFVVWGLSRREVRHSCAEVLRTFASPKIGGVVFVAAAYSAAVVYGLTLIGYWDRSMLKDAMYWFVGVAFVSLVNLAGKDERYLRRVVRQTFEVSAVIAFVVNLYMFPLYLELVLVPVIFLVAISLAVAQSRSDFASARRVLNGALIGLGALLLSHALLQAATDWAHFASQKTVLTFLVLPMLTFAFVPFLYLFALIMAYELIFLRVPFARRDKCGRERRTPMRLRFMIVRACGLRLWRVNQFTPEVMPKLFAASSDAEVEEAVRAWPRPA